MSKSYNPRDYHDRPLATIAFEDGVKWTIHYPKASDRHLLSDIGRQQQKRLLGFQASLEAWKNELREKALSAAGAADDDEAGRAVIEAAEAPFKTPDDLSMDYWHAEVLAAFIVPSVTAAEVLERLGNEYDLDFLYERHAELMDVLDGAAAKKRIRSGNVK